ncbi:MAG TPA: toxin-antitoxin system HicB family antitoxin [Pirellulales bacterium]|nr:toxin-antitoxin system HicB family antitoxin [Pirellulales bacterium]
MPAKKSIEARAREALAFAREAAKAQRWIDFDNALFGVGGKLTELFPNAAERTAYIKTAESKEVLQLLSAAMDRENAKTGHVAEELASANGTLTVRVPRAVHAALLAEAKVEGVSLNQLCLSKLVFQLRGAVQVA